ncbi:MAG: pitrilysin family protein [Treponemataceae bacterium]
MKKFIKKILTCFAILAFIACETIPSSGSSYMRKNAPTISEYTLDNGIKLIVKKQTTNRIRVLDVRYVGGNALLPAGQDGIEYLTLSCMQRGSEKYSNDEIKDLLHKTSSTMKYGAGLDMSWSYMATLDKYWDEMLDVFTDSLINPSFDEEQYNFARNEAETAYLNSLTDQYELMIDKLTSKSRAGHPYGKSARPTSDSLKNINLPDLKKWHAEKMTADRIFVVAVGNFNGKNLASQLNKTLGKLPKKDTKIPEIPPLNLQTKLYKEEFKTANGSAYVRGDYEIPGRTSPDFPKLLLAYSILDELLFTIVRTDHGAAYSVWCGVHGFKQSYGSLVIYRTDVPSEAKLYFDEAIAVLASGKTVKLKDDGKPYRYAPIAETIEAYKAKYKNAFFAGQFSNASTAAQIAMSYYYKNSPIEYLRLIDEINAVTPEDVIEVVNKYLVNAKISWMVVSDSATLSKLKTANYERFTGTKR